MSLLRSLFPSFEKPLPQRRHSQLEPQRRSLTGIGVVLAASALFGGILLALPEAPQHTTVPPRFLVAAPVTLQAPVRNPLESTATATDENGDEPSAAQLAILCGDRPTARRVCIEAKAAREAQAEALARAEAKTAAQAKAATAAKVAAAARAEASAAEQHNRNPRSAQAANDRAGDQLVHVYDHIAPDGRRVPVYRRPDGGYEFGAMQEAPPRPERRADVQQRHTDAQEPAGLLGLLGLD
ncbi:MAG: hypothetical protein WD073_07660 [Xanthobacteraceae bacterium]